MRDSINTVEPDAQAQMIDQMAWKFQGIQLDGDLLNTRTAISREAWETEEEAEAALQRLEAVYAEDLKAARAFVEATKPTFAARVEQRRQHRRQQRAEYEARRAKFEKEDAARKKRSEAAQKAAYTRFANQGMWWRIPADAVKPEWQAAWDAEEGINIRRNEELARLRAEREAREASLSLVP
jgi:hypothetical protein